MADEAALRDLLTALTSAGDAQVLAMLAADPSLAQARVKEGATRSAVDYLVSIDHHVYAGDTALHIAAAAHRADIVEELISLGADTAAKNRRGATPLHYAADGVPGSARWRPQGQADSIACLITFGADPNAVDKGGVTPLHRAARTRCSPAVEALLAGGADPSRKTAAGSTPMMLATKSTGRGGSGGPEAKAEQAKIIRLLEDHADG